MSYLDFFKMKTRVWKLLTNLYKNICNEENVFKHIETINLFQNTTNLHQTNGNIWAKIGLTFNTGSLRPAKSWKHCGNGRNN